MSDLRTVKSKICSIYLKLIISIRYANGTDRTERFCFKTKQQEKGKNQKKGRNKGKKEEGEETDLLFQNETSISF
jgi:hypothetical protein